jgi:outer membrane porin, OprD family
MQHSERRRTIRLSAPLLGLATAAVLAVNPARADQDDDAERVPSNAAEIYSPIARTFTRQAALPGGPLRHPLPVEPEPPVSQGPVLLDGLKQRLLYTDPFFRDAIVELYGRTGYLDRHNFDDTTSQAWAAGTALAVRSGYFDGWLQLEAAVASSQPVYAPDGEGGTLLLTYQQAEVSSVAIANARVRLPEQELILGRQLVKTPYINPEDTRMIPNTVEGAVVTRRRDKAARFDYGVGYLWGFKARDSSTFVPFSQTLGVPGDRGVLVAGFKARPLDGLTFGAIEYRIPDVLNTAYAEIDWLPRPVGDVQLHFAINYTDQRTIGDELLQGRGFTASQVSALFAASYRDATVLAAVSSNGNDADLVGPFGSFPAYTVLDQLNFNDAGETTLVLGAAYDFSHVITDGLKAQVRYGMGWGVVDFLTGAPQPDQNELNLELAYHPSAGPLKDLNFQVFYSGVRFPGAPATEDSQPQFRSVLTYLVPVL